MNKHPDRKVENEAIMTCAEVAEFLRVHLSSVRRWSRSGELKAYKVGSRGDWRYREQDVRDFLYNTAGRGPKEVRMHRTN